MNDKKERVFETRPDWMAGPYVVERTGEGVYTVTFYLRITDPDDALKVPGTMFTAVKKYMDSKAEDL